MHTPFTIMRYFLNVIFNYPFYFQLINDAFSF